MKAILLCAGYATRLYPLTKDTPKPLLQVSGKPMMEWILERLELVEGLEEVCIVTNHKFAGHFEKWVSERGEKFPWPIHVVDDQTTTNENRLGAIGDLAFALKKRNIGAEDIMVLAGDNLFDFDLIKFTRDAKTNRPHGAIAVYDVKDRELAKQYGLVEFGPDRKVIRFLEKPTEPPTTQASCGIYWLPKETRVLLDRYLAGGHNPDQPGHYMRWLAENHGLYAVTLEGCWLDIGDHASYEKANALGLKK